MKKALRILMNLVMGILLIYAMLAIDDTYKWIMSWEQREAEKTFDALYLCVGKGNYAEAQKYTEGISQNQLRDFWRKSVTMLKTKEITEHVLHENYKSKDTGEVTGVVYLRAKNHLRLGVDIRYRRIKGKIKIVYLEPGGVF